MSKGPADALLNGLKMEPKLQVMEGAKNRSKFVRTQWKQWAACISATLSMVAVGTVYGWITTTNSRLKDTPAEIPVPITDEQWTWIVSVTVIGSTIGAFCGAYISASCGRKLCLLTTSVFYIIGWLLIIFPQNIWYIYVARVILGVGVGMSYTANPMYISEVADVNIRGALSTLTAVNVFTGSLIACSVGPWNSYFVLGVVLLAVPVLFVLTFAWFPETPYYLVSKGKNDEAAAAISFFTGIKDEESLQAELDLVRKNLGDDSNGSFDELKFSFSDFMLLMKVKNRRALLIVMGLILGQQLSGNFTTIQYLETMFQAAKIGIDPHMATIIVLAVGLVSGAMATMTVENAGRRPLLIYSSFGCAVTLGILGSYLVMNARGTDVSSFNLLPVFDVIAFVVIYQIGLGTMPNLLIGELFPTNVKGIAGAIITIFDGLLGFIVAKQYTIGSHWFYLFFSASCFVLFVFVYGFVPETKQKTFNEIQDILGKMRPFKMSTGKSRFWSFSRSRKVGTGEA